MVFHNQTPPTKAFVKHPAFLTLSKKMQNLLYFSLGS